MTQTKAYLIGFAILAGAVLLSLRFDKPGPKQPILYPVMKNTETIGEFPLMSMISDAEVGYCTYYSSPEHGRKTASGEIYDSLGWTAAHKTLPFGTKVVIYNIRNKRWIITRINDRLPNIPAYHDRVLDVSVSCNEAIGGSGKEKIILLVLKNDKTKGE